MKDLIRKSMYLGLGLAGETKERVENIANEIASQTKMTEDQGKEFAEYLQKESQKARQDLHDTVNGMVNTAMKHTPGIGRIQSLEERVAALEKESGKESEQEESRKETGEGAKQKTSENEAS